MAKKIKIASEQDQKRISLTVSRDEADKKIQARIEEGEKLLKDPINSSNDLEDKRLRYNEWSDYNCELLRRIFDGEQLSREYNQAGFGVFSMSPTFSEKIEYVHIDIQYSLNKLRSILKRLDLYPEPKVMKEISEFNQGQSEISRNIFIVHGLDDGMKQTVARFIEKLKLNPIILHEQPNEGRTLIEKFENYSKVGFAVIILTPDDVGCVKGGILQPRARQNVVLELGYFIGLLKRKNVCALLFDDVEIPSDLNGIVYVKVDDAGGWKFKLAREIKCAGIDVDLNMLSS